jgi:hypothetical protein
MNERYGRDVQLGGFNAVVELNHTAESAEGRNRICIESTKSHCIEHVHEY